ncbi:hypothetical protein KI385_35620 [Streptomyces inhibens]|nr:hypothetical protein [Streptomyces inhibens]UKY55612.1 hypothetical protein KI385_35620 [Streptomyces inhibens]
MPTAVLAGNDQDAVRTAEHAVRFAIERLDDSTLAPRACVLDPKFVVRGTSGPPRDTDRPA